MTGAVSSHRPRICLQCAGPCHPAFKPGRTGIVSEVHVGRKVGVDLCKNSLAAQADKGSHKILQGAKRGGDALCYGPDQAWTSAACVLGVEGWSYNCPERFRVDADLINVVCGGEDRRRMSRTKRKPRERRNGRPRLEKAGATQTPGRLPDRAGRAERLPRAQAGTRRRSVPAPKRSAMGSAAALESPAGARARERGHEWRDTVGSRRWGGA